MENQNDNYKKLLKEKKLSSVGLTILIIGLFAFIIGLCGVTICVPVGIVFLIVGGILFFGNYSSTDMKDFQENITREILSSRFILNEYSKNGFFPIDELKTAGFCSKQDDIKPNDYIDAIYKNFHFIYADAICYHMVETYDEDSGYSEHEEIDFKGPVIKLKSTNNINGSIFIKEKGAKLFKKNVIKTGDDSFDKHYTTYSDKDEAEVVSVINSKVTYALMNLDEYAGKKNKLFAYFNDDEVYIGLNNNKDIFEKTPKGLDKMKDIFKEDADFICAVLDTLISTGIYFE